MIKKILLLLWCIGLLCTACTSKPDKGFNIQNDAGVVNWEEAKWISYTKDDRPKEWSSRSLTRNQPPSDINTWVPTPKELEPVTRKVHLSPLLRKHFVASKPIAKAEVAVSGLGLYELFINGKKVGDRVLEPAQTSYDKRVFYTVFDVTSYLKHKDNAIALQLGNGFYGQNMAFTPKLQYGVPRALLMMKIFYTDGSVKTIVTDESWKGQSGPILFDNIYLGETYDARREIESWDKPSFDDSHWDNVDTISAPGGEMQEQEVEPMRKVREVTPKAILPSDKGWIVDMGQNMTGWLQISFNESEGTVIDMRFSEHLMPDRRTIDPASTGIHVTGDVQKDIYICKGVQDEQWEPRFTYHGFRYVQIEGLSQKPKLDQLKAWLVRTDANRTGEFKCSDSLINTFYEVSMWTIEDNIQGILTDCPHRERCAWMGDAYVVAEAASFNFDLMRLWRKMSADMSTVIGVSPAHFKDDLPYDPRTPSNIAVGKRLCLQARPDWGAATVMLPWYSYVYYGDKQIVSDAWEMMQGWMDYLDEKAQYEGIINAGYGDWCPPGGNSMMDTPPSLTTTALYYQSLMAMHKMALVLEKEEVAAKYLQDAAVVKAAFNKQFFNVETHSYGSQTGNAFALFSQLVLEGQEQAVADDLAQLIMDDKQGHYTTGIFGHRALYSVLNDYGYANVTRHLWRITDYPSLGFMTEKHDLTTWPEGVNNWEEGKRYHRHSYNHPMNSGFAASFHESLAGIRPNEDYPGFKKFFLKPTFLPDLEWIEASHQSKFGEINSCWKRHLGSVEWKVSIPQSTKALIQLTHYDAEDIRLDGKVVSKNEFSLKSGDYTITIVE